MLTLKNKEAAEGLNDALISNTKILESNRKDGTETFDSFKIIWSIALSNGSFFNVPNLQCTEAIDFNGCQLHTREWFTKVRSSLDD